MEPLRAALGIPEPPFAGADGGLDVDLINALAERLGASAEFVLRGKQCDCVTGATVGSEANMLPPYLISGQALAVDAKRRPRVRSVDDLAGLTVGVLPDSTGQSLAERTAGAIRGYGSIGQALTDLSSGACDAVIALAPVLTVLIKSRSGLEVVQRGLTVEKIAVAVAPGDQALLARLTVAQAELEDDGTLQQIRRKWLGNPFADQRLAVH